MSRYKNEENPYRQLGGRTARVSENDFYTKLSHDTKRVSTPAVKKFVDSERTIRQVTVVHRAAEYVAALFPDGELTPIRDRVGCFGYRLDSRDSGIRAVLGAKSSTAGGWLSCNQKLLDLSDQERRRLLLVLLPSDRYPDRETKVLELDTARIRLEGNPNRYNGQQMVNFTWSCTHPFRLRPEPVQQPATPTAIQTPLFGGS